MAEAHRAASALTTHGCELLAVSEAKLKQKLDEADPFLRYWVDYLSKRVLAGIYLDRIVGFLLEPPPECWDGIIRFSKK